MTADEPTSRGGPAAASTEPTESLADRNAWLRVIVAQAACVGAVVSANAAATAGDRFHWWANFVLLPGAVIAASGLGLRRAGPAGRATLLWVGGVVFVVGLLLLMGRMGELWPLMISIPALGPVLLYAVRTSDASFRALADTVAGWGVGAVALGAMFLAMDADLVDPGRSHWWAWFMLAGGAVPLGTGTVLLTRRRGTYWFSTAVLLLAIGGFTILAALREYRH